MASTVVRGKVQLEIIVVGRVSAEMAIQKQCRVKWRNGRLILHWARGFSFLIPLPDVLGELHLFSKLFRDLNMILT